MNDHQRAFETGRLQEAIKELFEAIPRAKRARLFAAMSLVEVRAMQSLLALALLETAAAVCDDSGAGAHALADDIRQFLRAAGWPLGE